MSKKNTHPVFELIKSLTKAEKRSFKLYVNRINEKGSTKFIMVFDIIDKMNVYDESLIRNKLGDINSQQLSNLKSHLYKQILLVLRLNYLKHDVDIQLREKLDYVRLLYKKGLYDQSLKMLNRVKKIADSYRKNIFKLALVNYEKNIETQQVLNLDEKTGKRLDHETRSYIRRISKSQQFLTLALLMKARFLKNGMVRSEKQLAKTRQYFEEHVPDFDETKMSFSEKYNMCRAFYWYSYMTYDFESCVMYTEKWVRLFQENDLYKLRHSEYLKGLSRLLQSLFRMGDIITFRKYFEVLSNFQKNSGVDLDGNGVLLLLRHQAIHSFNLCFMEGDFEKHQQPIEKLIRQVEKNVEYIDINNILVIYYKAAIMYFGLEDYDNSLKYLEKITNDRNENIRDDLKSFAHILSLITLYENVDDEKLEQRIKSVYVILKNQKNLGSYNKIIIDFIKNLPSILPNELKKEFRNLRENLLQLSDNQYESKSLLYFDIISWLEAKINNKSFQEVVLEKRQIQNF